MSLTASHACPDRGAWRAWLDGEAEDQPALDAHINTCAGCASVVHMLREDARFASTALACLAPHSDPSRTAVLDARQRVRGRATAPAGALVPVALHVRRLPSIPPHWRVASSGLAAAVVISVLVALTPQGRAAASEFLSQFRSQQVAAVEVSPQSQAEIARTLSALSNMGTLEGVTPSEIQARERAAQQREVTLAEASRAVGFAVKTPDPAQLPASLAGQPRILVTPAMHQRFTFDKVKADAYLQSTGHAGFVIPPQYDGATLEVSVPAAALLQYGDRSTPGRDALVIGQAGEITVDVQGKVSLAEMRDFLLSLPGLPPSIVPQLKSMTAWDKTLPIPVPIDRVHWTPVTFADGGKGLLLDDNSGVGSAAVWQANGHLYGVAGSLRAHDLKRVADRFAATP